MLLWVCLRAEFHRVQRARNRSGRVFLMLARRLSRLFPPPREKGGASRRAWRKEGKNDKKSQKVSLAFCGGTPYNRNAKWLKVEGNGAFSPEEEGQQR